MSPVCECKYFNFVHGRLYCSACGALSPKEKAIEAAEAKMMAPGEDKTLKPAAKNKAARQGRRR